MTTNQKTHFSSDHRICENPVHGFEPVRCTVPSNKDTKVGKSCKELKRTSGDGSWCLLDSEFSKLILDSLNPFHCNRGRKVHMPSKGNFFFSFNVTFQQKMFIIQWLPFKRLTFMKSQTWPRRKAQLSQDFGKCPF